MNTFSRRLLCASFLCFAAPLACSSEPPDPILGSGGATGAGGSAGTGGSGAGGAASGSGGAASGGAAATGGAASGGAASTGGNSATGGETASGGASATGGGDGSGGGNGSGVQVYILFGQSNMWGEPLPQAQDMVENPNIEVLTRISCGNHGKNEWVTALPPLHECVGQQGSGDSGPGVGPGDYFAKTVAAQYPNDKILLIPNAIPGVPISTFAVGSATYNEMIMRAELGQERGEIKGILFHQGESDCGSSSWPNAVKAIVDAMRDTLGTGDIPFLAGEIPRSSQCSNHNPQVAQLANIIDNAHVISSEGLSITDQYHFGLEAQRTFGTRYGEKMLELLGQ